jgi:hypothetical protein
MSLYLTHQSSPLAKRKKYYRRHTDVESTEGNIEA